MKQLHLVLQGKGGVGKSKISAVLMQYFQRLDRAPIGIDTDPVNATLASYERLDVKLLEIVKGSLVDQRSFDDLVELVVAADDEAVFVVDNGASTFLPLCAYLFENDTIDLLRENGVQVYIHTIITGGQALSDTINGFAKIVKDFPTTPIVVWLNEFFGKIAVKGVPFEKMKLYSENKDHIAALVTLEHDAATTFAEDIRLMLEEKMTFEQAVHPDTVKFGLPAKHRINKTWNAINDQLNNIQF